MVRLRYGHGAVEVRSWCGRGAVEVLTCVVEVCLWCS